MARGLLENSGRADRSRWISAAIALGLAGPAGASPLVRWIVPADDPTRAHVEATLPEGVPAPARPDGWRQILRVSTLPDESAHRLPAMAGRYEGSERLLRFRPAFPLQRGLHYRASLQLDDAPPSVADLQVPPPDHLPPAAQVTTIAPTAEALPLNLLKFYLHFSAPMTRGSSYRHIKLVDADGVQVEDPFLELPEELWNPDMTRLTILLDPGRIKRGLLPHETVGAVLQEGKRYTLTVAADWKDASGQFLARPAAKTFVVSPADYRQPDPAGWRFGYPTAHTRQALELTFGEPLDSALVDRLLTVRDSQDNLVDGEVSLADHAQRWRFVPTQPWQPDLHTLHIDHRIEDLAGNSIARLFEETLDRHPESAGEPPRSSEHAFTPASARP